MELNALIRLSNSCSLFLEISNCDARSESSHSSCVIRELVDCFISLSESSTKIYIENKYCLVILMNIFQK